MILPFIQNFKNSMIETMKFLLKEANTLIGYTQSDEISLIYYQILKIQYIMNVC